MPCFRDVALRSATAFTKSAALILKNDVRCHACLQATVHAHLADVPPLLPDKFPSTSEQG